MSELTLYYFDSRGRAEPIRLMLKAAGKAFEDKRLTKDEWAELKKKGVAPSDQLPFIELKNGNRYGESKAIANYVAKTCGMMGKTAEDALKVDEVACLAGSLTDKLVVSYFEQDPVKKEQMWSTAMKETVPKYVGFFEKRLEDDGHYLAGSLSMADLVVYDVMETMQKFAPTVLDQCPRIKKLREEVQKDPKIKAYLQTRPQTEH